MSSLEGLPDTIELNVEQFARGIRDARASLKEMEESASDSLNQLSDEPVNTMEPLPEEMETVDLLTIGGEDSG